MTSIGTFQRAFEVFHLATQRAVQMLPVASIQSSEPLVLARYRRDAENRDRQLVHAAAVGTPAGGVLITGKGGTRKSTTALACLAAGLDYVGDDYVLLSGGARPAAHSLYRTAKVEVADMARFARFSPRILGDAASAGEAKAVMYLDHVSDSLPLVAAVTPRFGDSAETGVEPVEPALLAGAATYTTLAQLPHAGQATVDFIAGVLARLPRHRLVLGRDFARVPEAVAALSEQPVTASSPRVATAPLVSVIVPVFNGAHFLPEAIASVLAQNYPAFEIIVVDDGSTDDIAAAVAALPAEVRFLRQANGGPAAARNHGIRAASADLIAFVDVDDLWPAGKLAAALAWLAEHPETDVVIGRAQLIEYGSFVGSPADSFACYIGAGLFRRSAFDRNGLFDPLLRFAEDVDWFASAERNGLAVDRLEQIMLNVRRHPGNSTRGKTGIELLPLHLARKALQRKRETTGDGQTPLSA
ncbi:glycosyltransferase [Sphingosinicellaceae bacterium]|nr:glycosyltransferase [Sphingosinicellaceae bacterium]